MRILELNVAGFRNIDHAALDFEEGAHFFCGRNGQGKTNMLEAMGWVTALRSFRTQDMQPLIQQGKEEARIVYRFMHDDGGLHEVDVTLSPRGKRVCLNGEPARQLADVIGQFPTVVLSAEDIYLLRGAPAGRRRFLDMTLSAMDSVYLEALRRYHKALQARNALLKEGSSAMLGAYEGLMAEAGRVILEARMRIMETLSKALASAYQLMAGSQEVAELIYKPDVADGARFEEIWEGARGRDLILKSTQRGVQRDDFILKLDGRLARDYASEGQQRGLVLALRFAQAAYYRSSSGLLPILLADDVLGQLDPVRRRGFWASVPESQIIATGTELPEIESHWSCWDVQGGVFLKNR